MPKVGDVIAGKYTIEQLIGLGGMGAVFAASHKFTGKRVALKWMLPELARDGDAVQRFMREAHAAGRINHPNVVDVYDVGEHDQSYFLVMEYLHGEPLTSALGRRDMNERELLQLLLPAMRGVAAAHRQGVVHRDLKPDNIFLAYEEDGSRRDAKVLDFGISKLSNESAVNPRLTRTGAVVGTPYYMSPEQIRGSAQLDKRADVYAFGVILYEALTGQVPFHAETYGALVLEIATATPRPPSELVPGLSSELSRVVLRAMAREALQRYPDMESLVHALEPFASGMSMASTTGNRADYRDPTAPHHGLHSTSTTRATDPATPPQPLVATRPQLASTPFASEAPEVPRRFPMYGPVLFVGAAIAIVGGVWFATREPEVAAPAGQVVMPAPLGAKPGAPPAEPAPPVIPPVPSVALPVAQPVAAEPPAATRNVFDTNLATDHGKKRPTANTDPADSASGTSSGSRSKYVRRRAQHNASSQQAETDSPPVTPPPTRKARSGTLSVEEF